MKCGLCKKSIKCVQVWCQDNKGICHQNCYNNKLKYTLKIKMQKNRNFLVYVNKYFYFEFTAIHGHGDFVEYRCMGTCMFFRVYGLELASRDVPLKFILKENAIKCIEVLKRDL